MNKLGWWRCCGGHQRIRLSGGFGSGSRDDLFHEQRLLSSGYLLSLLPLGIVVIQGRGQNSIRKQSTTAKEQRSNIAQFSVSLMHNISVLLHDKVI